MRHVDVDQFLDTLPETIRVAHLRPRVGEYLFEGAPIISVWASESLSDEDAQTLVTACRVGKERTVQQDLLFGIRQLVDIALKALSPGINDPTTAENCLDHLGDTVAQLAARPFPATWRRHRETGALLLLNRADFGAIVEAAFGQIRRECADDVHVTSRLLAILAAIAERIEEPERARAIRHQVEEVLAALDGQAFTADDMVAIRELAARAFAATDSVAIGSRR